MHNKIQRKFSTNDSEKTKDTIQKQYQANCRMCFQKMQFNEVPNICKCEELESAIHNICLQQWIKSANVHEEGLFSYYTQCNVCKAKIYLTTKTTYNWIPWRKMDFCHKQLCCTIAMGLVFFIGILMIIMSLLLLKSQPKSQTLIILSYSSMVIGSIISVLDIISFVYLMMISKQVQATGIKGVKLQEYQQKYNPQVGKNLQSPTDSYSKISIQITSEQMLEDISQF